MSKIPVYVFNHHGKRKLRFTAYTLWVNPDWSGACRHDVEAVNGTAAKKVAIQQHKETCVPCGSS